MDAQIADMNSTIALTELNTALTAAQAALTAQTTLFTTKQAEWDALQLQEKELARRNASTNFNTLQ